MLLLLRWLLLLPLPSTNWHCGMLHGTCEWTTTSPTCPDVDMGRDEYLELLIVRFVVAIHSVVSGTIKLFLVSIIDGSTYYCLF